MVAAASINSRRSLYIAGLALCVLAAGCAGPVDGHLADGGLRIAVCFHAAEMTYGVTITNVSGKAVAVLDQLSHDSHYWRSAGPAKIKIINDKGRILSAFDVSLDGWYTSLVHESSATLLPIKLTTLGPSESLTGVFHLDDLCMGLKTEGNMRLREQMARARVSLRIRVYHGDAFLSRWTEVEAGEWPILP